MLSLNLISWIMPAKLAYQSELILLRLWQWGNLSRASNGSGVPTSFLYFKNCSFMLQIFRHWQKKNILVVFHSILEFELNNEYELKVGCWNFKQYTYGTVRMVVTFFCNKEWDDSDNYTIVQLKSWIKRHWFIYSKCSTFLFVCAYLYIIWITWHTLYITIILAVANVAAVRGSILRGKKTSHHNGNRINQLWPN